MQNLTRFPIFAGKVLLLAAPQFVISLVTILLYVKAAIYPDSAVGLHLAIIVTGHIAFFGAWALAARREGRAEKKWFRHVFTLSLVLKCLALNLVYFVSFTSYQLWSSFISWQNLRALGPHLEGFYRAFGGVVILALGGIVGFIALAYLVFYKLSPRLLRWLQWTYAGPLSRLYSMALLGLAALLSLYFWSVLLNGDRALARDPIYAFWSNDAAKKPVLTPEMLADRAARNYTPPAEFHRRNVIVVIIDCLRADHFSFHGYARPTTPFLGTLAAEGRLQEADFAVANGNDSPQGIRAILSSRLPHHQNIYNLKLHDALKLAGYRTHVFATGDHTTLGDMRRHYGSNIDVFADGLTFTDQSINDDRGLLAALKKIGPADGRPAFFFFHLMSVHSLGVKEKMFQRWNPSWLKLDWDTMISGHYKPEEMINTYDNGLLQADHILAEIFATLKAKGYLNDYIAALTGDHGEGLGERGNYGHTRFLFMEDINVPIIFFESGRVDYGPMPFASHVDIAPTLLARLGLPLPDRWEGRSLFQAPAPDTAYAVSTRMNGWRAVIRQRHGIYHKYMFYGVRRDEFREYLFNLTQDPEERTNLIANAGSSALLGELRQLAAQQFQRPIPPPE